MESPIPDASGADDGPDSLGVKLFGLETEVHASELALAGEVAEKRTPC